MYCVCGARVCACVLVCVDRLFDSFDRSIDIYVCAQWCVCGVWVRVRVCIFPRDLRATPWHPAPGQTIHVCRIIPYSFGSRPNKLWQRCRDKFHLVTFMFFVVLGIFTWNIPSTCTWNNIRGSFSAHFRLIFGSFSAHFCCACAWYNKNEPSVEEWTIYDTLHVPVH